MWHTIPALGTGLLTASLVASGFTFFLAALASSRPRLLAAARRAAYGTAAWTTAAAQASNPPSARAAIDRGNRRENGSWDMAGSEVTDRQDPPIVGAPPVRHT